MMQSRVVDAGGQVHFTDFGGEGPRTFVLVHGLGGSSVNWAACAPALSRLGRVIAPDLAGFGRSPGFPGSSAVDANRALLGRFLKKIASGPAVLIGNSMGGMIAMLQAAHEPASVSALVLACPALLPAPFGSHDLAVSALFGLNSAPILGEYLTRRQRERTTPQASVEGTLKLCGLDPQKLDPAVLALHVDLARDRLAMPWAIPCGLEATRSLMTRMAFERYRVEAAMKRVAAPTLLLQGLDDRLVLPVSSRKASRVCPRWRLEELHGVGHLPMLQEPKMFVERVGAWLSSLPLARILRVRG